MRSEVKSCLWVTTGIAGTTFVEAVKEDQWSWVVQEPPCWVGQEWFPGACLTAPGVAETVELLSRPPLTQLENIGSVYPFYVYDGNRLLAPILHKTKTVQSDV